MKKIILSFLILILLSACSTMKKAGAYTATPFAAIADTCVAPFQLIGDAGDALIDWGDKHTEEVCEKNKGSLTLPLDKSTSLFLYVPGYILSSFNYITPDNYYPLTKKCIKVINSEEENKFNDKRIIKSHKPTDDNFEEW